MNSSRRPRHSSQGTVRSVTRSASPLRSATLVSCAAVLWLGGLVMPVWAQGGADAGAAPRPPGSRYYGTNRPPGPPGAPPPPAAPMQPPPGFAMPRPPAPPPPGVSPYYRPPAYRPPNVGIVVGPVWPRPWAYPYGYPAYPYSYPYPAYPTYPTYAPGVVVTTPAIVTTPPAVTYVERTDQAEAPAAGYWYWCASPSGWYPEVSECPGGWQPVAPREQ